MPDTHAFTLSPILIRGEKRLKLVSDDAEVIKRFQSVGGAKFHEGKRFWHVPDTYDRDELERMLSGGGRGETMISREPKPKKKKRFWSGKDIYKPGEATGEPKKRRFWSRKQTAGPAAAAEGPGPQGTGGLPKRMLHWKIDAFKAIARTVGSLRTLVSIALLILIGLAFGGFFDFDFLKLFEISSRIGGFVFVIPVLIVPILGALAFLFGNKGTKIDWEGFYGISCWVAFIALMVTAIGTVGVPYLWKLTEPFICPEGYGAAKGIINTRAYDMPGLVVNVNATPVCTGELGTFVPNEKAGFVVLTAWFYLSFFIPAMAAAVLIKGPMVLRNAGLVLIPLLSAGIYLAPIAAPQQMRVFARPFETQLNREFYADRLESALRTKKPEVAKRLLAGGANPNRKNDMGQLPLVVAARSKDYDMVRLLIESGADPRLKDKRGNGVLPVVAASRGDREEKRMLIDLLLEKGVDVDQTDEEGETALMKAVSDIDLAEHLIEKGANVRHRNVRGENVMIRALYYGDRAPGLVRFYQKKGIDINERTHYQHTPLTLAVHGYFRPAFSSKNREYLSFVYGKRKGLFPDDIKKRMGYKNPRGVSIDTVRTLLAIGADVNAQNIWGNSAVMTTLKYCGDGRSRRNESFVRSCRSFLGLFLRRSGVDYSLKNKEGKTALDYAGWDRDVYGYIKGRSAPAAVTTSEAKRKQERAGSPDELVRQVVRYGKYRHVGGGTTLKHITTMLENGVDPNRRAKDGSLALVAAASMDMPDIVRELTAHGAGVDRKDARGNTALHAAVKKGNYDMCELLLAKGADRSVRDRSGKRPVDHAKAMERLDLIELLQ